MLEQQIAGIKGQMGQIVESQYFFKLKCLLGQTAQLAGGSAAGLCFANNIIGVEDQQIVLCDIPGIGNINARYCQSQQ